MAIPILNKVVLPLLAIGALGYAVVATEVMRPRTAREEPLRAPPERPFARAVAGTGLVEPASELVSLAARVPGWIAAVHVAAGDRVAKGDPILTLDGADLAAELLLRQEALAVAQRHVTRLRASPRPEDVPPAQAAVAEAAALLADAESKLARAQAASGQRAVSDEEVSSRRHARDAAAARFAKSQAELARLLDGAWDEDIAVAQADAQRAAAAVARVQADIARLTVHAPIDALVLRLDARAGEYAAAGGPPLALLGAPPPLHLRVDFNEEEAWRVRPTAKATARPRGRGGPASSSGLPLEFVRIEPQVIPKQALSGGATERVDTRAMQAIYRLPPDAPAMVGQQMDVYVEEEEE